MLIRSCTRMATRTEAGQVGQQNLAQQPPRTQCHLSTEHQWCKHIVHLSSLCVLRFVSSEHGQRVKSNSLTTCWGGDRSLLICEHHNLWFPVAWPARYSFCLFDFPSNRHWPGAALNPSYISMALIPALFLSSLWCFGWSGWMVERCLKDAVHCPNPKMRFLFQSV